MCLLTLAIANAICPNNRDYYAKLAETSDYWKERLAYMDKMDNVNNCLKKQIDANEKQILLLEQQKSNLLKSTKIK